MNSERKLNCYNCGERGHISVVCPNEDQQFTRCPCCNNVAKSKSGHKITCKNTRFISTQIGAYELPLKEFHNIQFVFKHTKDVYSAEKTSDGVSEFLITKFLSLGTNIKYRRVYDGSDNVILDMKLKPSATIGFGRRKETTHMASAMFCDDHIRLNHFHHIDRLGTVSYSSSVKPRTDESHDVELKIDTVHRVIIFTVNWNNKWSVNIAMSNKAVTVGHYNID